jgi:hypothetical protein
VRVALPDVWEGCVGRPPRDVARLSPEPVRRWRGQGWTRGSQQEGQVLRGPCRARRGCRWLEANDRQRGGGWCCPLQASQRWPTWSTRAGASSGRARSDSSRRSQQRPTARAHRIQIGNCRRTTRSTAHPCTHSSRVACVARVWCAWRVCGVRGACVACVWRARGVRVACAWRACACACAWRAWRGARGVCVCVWRAWRARRRVVSVAVRAPNGCKRGAWPNL